MAVQYANFVSKKTSVFDLHVWVKNKQLLQREKKRGTNLLDVQQSLEDEQAARAEMEAALESLQEAVEEPNSKDQTGAMEDQHLVKQNADV
jgi:hypothetical protein